MMIRSIISLICIGSVILLTTASAQLPQTDIYKLELNEESLVEKVHFMTAFNESSYNNQPKFVNTQDVLLTCELEESKTDIVKWNLRSNSYKRMTATKENEYSPQVVDEDNLIVVREELDGKTQSLWSYPYDLSSAGERLFPKLDNIGYFEPLPNFRIALFTLEGEKFPLLIGNLRNGTTTKIADDIGRCFQKNKRGELLFLNKQASGKYRLKIYNPINQQIVDYAQALEGAQDFCLYGPREYVLMAVGPEIFKFDSVSNTWVLWQDLAKYGIFNITRMAVEGRTLLIVNTKS